MLVAALGVIPLTIWLYLVFGRGGFWRARERDDRDDARRAGRWPSVVAVVPARDEADVIARAVGRCWRRIIPALSASSWSTTRAATARGDRRRPRVLGNEKRLTVMGGAAARRAGPASCGRSPRASRARAPRPRPIISGSPTPISATADNLRHLVARAEAGRAGSRLADGAAALPERGRAFPRSGLRLLLRRCCSPSPG